MENNKGKNLAIASIVLGVISILSFNIGAIGLILGLICGIVGLVLSNKSKNENYNNTIRTVGFVCSIVGIVINVFLLIGVIIILFLLNNSSLFKDVNIQMYGNLVK